VLVDYKIETYYKDERLKEEFGIDIFEKLPLIVSNFKDSFGHVDKGLKFLTD
jgi:hypothetical protein